MACLGTCTKEKRIQVSYYRTMMIIRIQARFLLAGFAALFAAASLHAMYHVSDTGLWPTNWPKELDVLRKQSRTLRHDQYEAYEIPFTNRQQLEAAWPQILAVKSPESPIILLKSRDERLGKSIQAGVRILAPLAGTLFNPKGGHYPPSAEGIVTNLALLKIGPPWPDDLKSKTGALPEFVVYNNGRWAAYSEQNRKTNDPIYERSIHRARTDIELIVDGDIVDLNRIALPAVTPIIDQRFHPGATGAVGSPPKELVEAKVTGPEPQPAANETPVALVRCLPNSGSSLPLDRELAEKIAQQGSRSLPALEQELRLGIKFKELNEVLKTNGSRRAAVVKVLAQIKGEQSTGLLVRSLADPPDNYGMRFTTINALDDRSLSQSQILGLLRNCQPEVASAGIVHAARAAASPEIPAALETLFDQDTARKQFKNEYGAATASDEGIWEIHLAAGRALKKDMVPEIRSKAVEILARLKAESLHPSRPDAPVKMGILSEAESTIASHVNRLAAFGEPIKDLLESASALAEGDYAKVLDMALARLGDRARAGRVAAYLIESPSPTIRVCAVLTLRLCGDRSAIPALKQALRDPCQRKDGSDIGPRDRLVYPIRVLAADALIELGEDPTKVRENLR